MTGSGGAAGPAHGLLGVADAGAFLARLVGLDAGSLVRIRSSPAAATSGRGGVARTALWARLPWDVLVTREVVGAGPGDATVSAAELLDRLADGAPDLPTRRDEQWRWPLPPAGGRVVESVATAELARLAVAAAGTLRAASAGGLARGVGQRVLRDALLDHVALLVTPADGEPVPVSQRLVQAVSRMGFLGPTGVDTPQARVYAAGRWVGISAPYGVAWLQSVKTLTVMPISHHPKG